MHTISSLCNTPLQQGAFSLYHGDYKSRSYYGSIKAASTSRENEKRRKSAARKCEWSKSQSEDQRSEIWQTDLMGHAEGRACLSEEGRSEIQQTNRTGHAEGRACLSAEQRREIWQTDWTGHAEGHAHLSVERHAENGANHLNLLLLLSRIMLQDK